jgi:hypothetical protein
VLLKYDFDGYVTRRRFHIYDNISLNSFRMRNVLDKSCRENKNTYFMLNNFYFANRTVCEIMSKNMVEAEATNDVTIWRIRVACWISKTTGTRIHTSTLLSIHRHIDKYVIFIAFPRKQ